MSRVPRIRFKGFEEDWEQRKFSEIVLRESNFRLSSPDLPCVEYEDVVSEAGILNNDIRSKKVVKAGIVFYDTHVLYGKLRPYLHNWLCPDFSGVAVGDWWVLKPCYVVREFIYRIIQTKRFDNATNQSSGSKMPRADWNLVSNTEFMIPSDSSEQEKIGLYFKKIDHLITLHQRKLEKLKIIKKSMLENLFPQNEEKTPKIRFLGFTKDWEQRKLGEYLIQYTEVTIINDQYPVLTSSRKGIFFQKDYYDGNQIASENNIGYNIVPYGYFTYRHMSDDEIFYFNINNIIDNGIVSTLYPVFTTNNRLDSKFLQYELNFGKEFRKYSVLQKQGGSRTYMYFNKLRDLKLTITTSLKEQECIRNLICSIDHLITLHQSKLEKLQKIKKSMLESMFV